MAGETVCPRCGHVNSFRQGRLPDSCVCRVCLSQLDWHIIPGAGPDCGPAADDVPNEDDEAETFGATDG